MSDVRIPAIGVSWFKLLRFDEPVADAATDDAADDQVDDDSAQDADDADGDSDAGADDDASDADTLGDAGKKALDRMKAEKKAAVKAATDAKRQAALLAKKVAEFEDRDKSELDRANAKAERAAERETKATARAVAAEVKALSVGQFADPSDAADVLMKDPSKYVDADGDIDTDAIEADLADLLERKPHWGKPEPAAKADPEADPTKPAKPKPKPDPGQGSRGTPAGVDFRTASDEDFVAELAKYGVRKRY